MPKVNLRDAMLGREGRLSRVEAAEYIGVTSSTLADWHRRGLGPASVKVGGRRFYRVSALNEFIKSGD